MTDPVTIMLVDDDPIIYRDLAGILRQWGYDVAAHPAAEDAWTALQAGARPDLLICDGGLTAMPGDELRRLMAADPALAPIPFLVYSGAPRDVDAGTRFLLKGNFRALVATISDMTTGAR